MLESTGLIKNNPVFWREVQRSQRLPIFFSTKARPIWLAVGIVFFAAFFRNLLEIFLVNAFTSAYATSTESVDQFWALMVNVLMTSVVFVVPPLAATAINKEREQHTLDALALTRLTAGQIYLGKWLGVQYVPLCILAGAFPLALVLGYNCDVGILATVLTFLYLLLNSGFFAAIGLTCSYYARRMAATTSAIIISVVLILFTVIGDQAFRAGQGWSPIIWFNPFYVVQVISRHLPDGAAGQSSFVIPNTGMGLSFPSDLTYDWYAVAASVLVEAGFIIGSLFCMTRHYRLRTER